MEIIRELRNLSMTTKYVMLGKTPSIQYTWYTRNGNHVAEFKIWDWWDSILNRMIELLDFMDERNPIYDDYHNFKDHCAMKENANEEFFKLFCENFGRFWD